MQKLNGNLLFSASDLVNFAECHHLSTLDLINLETPLQRSPDDDQMRLIAEKGNAHEASYRDAVASLHGNMIEIRRNLSLHEAAAATLAAMRSGAPIIYQGTFLHENQ